MYGNKFTVVNDDEDHGGVAFCWAITILRGDKCKDGTVYITAKISEHNNYKLLNETINPLLVAGIKDSKVLHLLLYTTFGAHIIPVP